MTNNENLVTLEVIKAFQLLFLTIVFSTGVVLNGLIWYALKDRKRLAIAGNVFLADLTFSLFFDSFLSIPFAITGGSSNEWTLGPFTCTMTGIFHSIIWYNGNLTLALIALDRYYAIVCPMKYRKEITTRRAIYALLTTWFLSIAVVVIPLSGWSTYVYHTGIFSCGVSHYKFPVYQLCIFGGFVAVPFFIMLIFYGYVYAASSLQQRALHAMSSKSPGHGISKNKQVQNKLPWIVVTYSDPTRTKQHVALILFSYLLCWSVNVPSLIADYQGTKLDDSVNYILYLIHRTLAIFNPLIYGIMNPSLKRRIKRMLCKKRRKDAERKKVCDKRLRFEEEPASPNSDCSPPSCDENVKHSVSEEEKDENSPRGFFDFVPDTLTTFRYGVDSSDILKKINPVDNYYRDVNKQSANVRLKKGRLYRKPTKKNTRNSGVRRDTSVYSNYGSGNCTLKCPENEEKASENVEEDECGLTDEAGPLQIHKRIYLTQISEPDLVMEVESHSNVV